MRVKWAGEDSNPRPADYEFGESVGRGVYFALLSGVGSCQIT